METLFNEAISRMADEISERLMPSIKEMLHEELATEATPQQEKKFYTIDEICEMYLISRPTVYRRAKDGKLAIVKNGGKSLIPVESVKM